MGGALAPGLDELVAMTGVPVLGVLPHMRERLVPAEDTVDLEDVTPSSPAMIDIAISGNIPGNFCE